MSADAAIRSEADGSAIAPALDRALALYPAPIAQRALQLLEAMQLAGSLSACRSRLTGDGFPVELCFSQSEPDALRLTVDVAAAAAGPRDASFAAQTALAQARGLLRDHGLAGADDPPAGASAKWPELARMQQEGPLEFGAWTGVRVAEAMSSAKLYVEVPAGARLPAWCPPGPQWADARALPRMIGYLPATGAIESYFRIAAIEPRQLATVLAGGELEARTPELVDLIETAAGRPLRGKLPGPSLGMSYTADAWDRRVTVYLFARSIWGGDARIRRGFSRLAGAWGANAARYLEATAALADREQWQTRHGLVGFTLRAAHPGIVLSIGLRPVALPPAYA